MTVSWVTLLRVGLASLLGYLIVQLHRFLLLLILSLLIAIAFRPLMQWV